HGGRQVDGAIAALDALGPIAEAVGDELTVLFDSGIRTGSDVVKALALGAKAVLIGRPFAYGLALGGQAGVEHVLRCLLAEFDLTMARPGLSMDDLEPGILATARWPTAARAWSAGVWPRCGTNRSCFAECVDITVGARCGGPVGVLGSHEGAWR